MFHNLECLNDGDLSEVRADSPNNKLEQFEESKLLYIRFYQKIGHQNGTIWVSANFKNFYFYREISIEEEKQLTTDFDLKSIWYLGILDL